MKIWAAVLIGFLLGASLQPIPNLKAQISQHAMGVHARHMTVAGRGASLTNADANMPGSQIVGFSCVVEGDQTECYFASKD